MFETLVEVETIVYIPTTQSPSARFTYLRLFCLSFIGGMMLYRFLQPSSSSLSWSQASPAFGVGMAGRAVVATIQHSAGVHVSPP